MADSRAQRMQVVLLLAKRHEDETAQRLGKITEQLGIEIAQLDSLNDYKSQYLQSQGEMRTGVRVDELINYTHFISRLGEACIDQGVKVDRMRQQLVLIQQDWRKKYQKRKNLEELIERLGREENALIEKQLQKELDELSSNQLQRDGGD
jgi:flagellar protein FliJ